MRSTVTFESGAAAAQTFAALLETSPASVVTFADYGEVTASDVVTVAVARTGAPTAGEQARRDESAALFSRRPCGGRRRRGVAPLLLTDFSPTSGPK